jgi:lysozyme family protein
MGHVLDFDFIFDYVMDHEDAGRTGVITRDAGGLTRFGICRKYHPEEYPALAQMSVADALARAHILFMRDYCPRAITRIESDRVAAKIVDIDFNLGSALGKARGVGIWIAQAACDMLGQEVAEDGVLGPQTLAAINSCDPEELLDAMCSYEQAKLEGEYARKGKRAPAGLLVRAQSKPEEFADARTQ